MSAQAARSLQNLFPHEDWRSATSTMTARWTFWLRLTMPLLCCSATRRKSNHWLGIRLMGKKSNPDAIGARISYQAGDLKRTRMKVGGGSYLSSHDPRMVLGIGNRPKSTGWKCAGRSPAAKTIH